jgi:DNA repair exonuclease SbcCD ATPase subunit
MAKQDDMQEELDTTLEDLSESKARVAELESASEVQAKKLLEQDATLASHSDTITVLKGQKANLISQVHTLRTNAKVNERQNSMLMVQLKQQSDDLVAWKGAIPNIAKPVRRTVGPTLVEQAVRTIKALNDEIYQTAASLTDCVDEIEKRFVDEPDDTAAALETLKSLLGTEIYTELDEESCMVKDDYNPFVLQTGFQACLAACCMRIITSWYPAEPEYGKFLEALYERIRGLGELVLSFLRSSWIN